MSFIYHIHTYTEFNVFSAFNPAKCTHLEQWAADCAAPGEQSWTSCRSQDSNPQPWVTSGFKSNALSIRPTTAYCNTTTAYCNTSYSNIKKNYISNVKTNIEQQQQKKAIVILHSNVSFHCFYGNVFNCSIIHNQHSSVSKYPFYPLLWEHLFCSLCSKISFEKLI